MERNLYLDYLKGVLIILVVIGHGIQFILYQNDISFYDNIVFKGIYMFHMPLFIAVSGYFSFFSLQRHFPRTFLISRFKYLFVPMIVWTLLEALIYTIMENEIKLVTFFYQFKNLLIHTPFWFLWAIIIYSIFFAFLKKIKMDNVYLLIVVIIMSFLYTEANHATVYNIINFYPFFALGYIFAKFDLKIYFKRVQKFLPVIIVLFVISFFLWDNNTYVYKNPVGLTYIYYSISRFFIGIISSILFLYLFYYLYKMDMTKIVTSQFIKSGKDSMAIYLIQGTIFYVITLLSLDMSNILAVSLFCTIVLSMYFSPYLIDLISNKSRLGGWLLFGKKSSI